MAKGCSRAFCCMRKNRKISFLNSLNVQTFTLRMDQRDGCNNSFFGAHTLASRIVSQEAKEGKSSATSLYWLFYYAGSAIVGTATGVVLTGWGWATFIFSLLLLVVAGFVLVFRAGKK